MCEIFLQTYHYIYFSKEDKDRNREDIIKELKQLKELLDLGIITKEEFEAKSSKLKK